MVTFAVGFINIKIIVTTTRNICFTAFLLSIILIISYRLVQELLVSRDFPEDLVERVCQIIELWGRGEALEEKRIVEIAGNLYGASREEVREALLLSFIKERIKGSFSAIKTNLTE